LEGRVVSLVSVYWSLLLNIVEAHMLSVKNVCFDNILAPAFFLLRSDFIVLKWEKEMTLNSPVHSLVRRLTLHAVAHYVFTVVMEMFDQRAGLFSI
jgi:hypothetical protein